ncbi:site-specific integrase [Pseudoalteromonas sp. C2R02]|uniref:site-specific integrase n=1 Tax=Pseudoalteromonas sp. C2R02 TaxID=2841565 RepID=UPI001C08F4A3|nr:site-specific integrase [Pseudoalteromonas sp. C2R02]MBU2969231.1 site-specific integrase [Pseudoalteromonas sp. C2R02]
MTIKLNHQCKGSEYPIPYREGGEVHTDLLSYLICRKENRSRLGGNLRPASDRTILNKANHIVFLLNLFEESDLDYREAEFKDVETIIESLYHEYDWEGDSLKVYVSTWRAFYDFLTLEAVDHNMIFPERGTVMFEKDKDNDFQSHTKRTHKAAIETETAVPDEYCEHKDDYRNDVISMRQFWKLYEYLYKNEDPVYAVMAATMLQTFLRIGGVMQFPKGVNKRNPMWRTLDEMKDKKQVWQSLSYRKKGGAIGTCIVHKETLQMIHDEYLSEHYNKYNDLFITNYCETLHAYKKGITPSDSFTWLNKHGTPVSIRLLQQAFERASAALGFSVHTHTMRHTGATQLLYRWGKENGIEVTEAIATDIHSWLKLQLGHADMETTYRYIRTVYRLKAQDAISELLPATLTISEEQSKAKNPEYASALGAMERGIKRHEEYMRGIEYKACSY